MFCYSIVFLCAVLFLSNGYPAARGSRRIGDLGGCYPRDRNVYSTNSSRSHTYPINGLNSGNYSHPIVYSDNYYTYKTPQQIHYASPHGGPAMSYPVHRGYPPKYVFQYKESGSRYGTLLAGLALFNLGALAGGAFGYSVGHLRRNHYVRYDPNEVCLFGVKKDNEDFEETRIDCMLISSFIYAEQAKQQNPQNLTVVTTLTNSAVVNTTNVQDTPIYVLSPNGTLVPPESVLPNAGNATSGAPATGGTVTSSVIITSTNTTTVSAVDVKGPAIQVTPEMLCYVMRRTTSMKHELPCGLLQTYADESLKSNSATRNDPAFTITSKPFENGTQGGDQDQGAAYN